MAWFVIEREVLNIGGIEEKDIERIAFWGKFVGAILTVYGLIIALNGLFTTIVGAIPGVLAFLVGRGIFLSAEHAKNFRESRGTKLIEIDYILKSAGRSFLLLGIIMFIFLVFYGLPLILLNYF